MNINVPDNMKDPTVIIVGKKTDDEQNKKTLAMMDNLEKKLDQQYRGFMEKVDSQKSIDQLHQSFIAGANRLEDKIDQKFQSDRADSLQAIDQLNQTFMERFDRMLAVNKSFINRNNNQRINDLRSEFEKRVKTISSRGGNSRSIKLFTEKLDSLESAIKSISLRPTKKSNEKNLVNSFDKILERIEMAIRKSGPRVIPSPS